jgi:hypothetical protein
MKRRPRLRKKPQLGELQSGDISFFGDPFPKYLCDVHGEIKGFALSFDPNDNGDFESLTFCPSCMMEFIKRSPIATLEECTRTQNIQDKSSPRVEGSEQ